MDDRDFQILNKEIEKVYSALELNLQTINKWQNEQDRRLQNAEEALDELERIILGHKSQLDVAETTHSEGIRSIREKITGINEQIRLLDERLDSLDAEFRAMHSQMDVTETRRSEYVKQNTESVTRIYNRITHSENLLNELDDVVKRLQAQVDVISAKQDEYKKISENETARYDEFKSFLIDTQRSNKTLWIPIVFSVICTIIAAAIPLFFH